MQDAAKHYQSMAEGIDLMREMARAMVAGLMSDGFSEEQARAIATGFFASVYHKSEEES